jgi:YbgC/YbaW family acyl-CoA thioester hydrolase
MTHEGARWKGTEDGGRERAEDATRWGAGDGVLSEDRRTFRTTLVVRSYEVDGFLHVNNAVFLHYLEAARGGYLRALGLGYAKFHEWGAFPVVQHATLDYHSSARADDMLVVEVMLTEWRRTQFVMRYVVSEAATGRRILSAETRHAFVGPDGDVVRVPADFRRAFEA